MNNFRKHCAFYIITFAPWRPPGNYKTMGVFSSCEVPLFSFWGALFVLLEAIFSMCGGGGGGWALLMWRNFYAFPHLQNFYGAHALDAKVVANIAPWGNLREIARLARHPIC